MAPHSRRRRNGVPTIEWVTGVVGLAIVLGTLGFIGYEEFRPGPDQPRLEVLVETSQMTATGLVATVLVRNTSRQAAAEVLVEGVIRAPGGGEQRSEVRLDYVPGLSTRRVSLVFAASPGDSGVAVRILGYTTP